MCIYEEQKQIIFKNHVFLLCYVFIVLVSCIFLVIFLPNQNNPTAE